MSKPLPRYLLDKYQLTGNLIFSVLFAIVFLALYIPFSTTAWFRLGYSETFLFTVLFVLSAIVFLILSRTIMYKTRFLFEIKVWQYILWCFIEVAIIAFGYVLLTVIIGRMPEDFTRTRLFMKALLYATISLVIPNLIACLYMMVVEKEKILRLMNYSNVVSDEPAAERDEQKITLFDIGGTLRFSVRRSNLYYIESDDNYIKVWYDDGEGNIKQYMVRCRLKTVEETFRGTSLVRCHRKYIVNTERVKVLRKEGDSFILELDKESINPIPVTKTYEKTVLSIFCPDGVQKLAE
ncbi:MAG: LytR/AlgR family response regulator transcription factor [Candidatus Cryptobacteroides sp.]